MIGFFFLDKSLKLKRLKEIYNIIRKHKEITIRNICLNVDCSCSTIKRTIEELLQANLIQEYSVEGSTGGRKPVTFRINPNAGYLIGIELSRIDVNIVITNLNLLIIAEDRFEASDTSNKTINNIITKIKFMITSIQLDQSKILGVGIGSVGLLDKHNGMIISASGFQPVSWDSVAIKQIVEEKLGCLTLLTNGVNCAVLAEYWQNVKQPKRMVYIMFGIGIRCGIIIDDVILSDLINNEDAFGHMIVEINGRKCFCGNNGCLESYASIPAMTRAFKEHVNNNPLYGNMYQLNSISWETVCQSVSRDERIGKDVINEASIYLGAGLANLINILRPNVVVLGGHAINSCQYLYQNVVSATKQKLGSRDDTVLFTKGLLGRDAVAIGAASLLIAYHLGISKE